MSAFLLQIELQNILNNAIEAFTANEKHLQQLFVEGKMYSYSISENHTNIWCVINAEDETEVMHLASKFPLQQYFTDVICCKLHSHTNLPISFPVISLN